VKRRGGEKEEKRRGTMNIDPLRNLGMSLLHLFTIFCKWILHKMNRQMQPESFESLIFDKQMQILEKLKMNLKPHFF
jgi:hypothetical protein